jgi:chromosome segregation ATPase
MSQDSSAHDALTVRVGRGGLWALKNRLKAAEARADAAERERDSERVFHANTKAERANCYQEIDRLTAALVITREQLETLRVDMAWTPSEQATEIRRLTNMLNGEAATMLAAYRQDLTAAREQQARLEAENQTLANQEADIAKAQRELAHAGEQARTEGLRADVIRLTTENKRLCAQPLKRQLVETKAENYRLGDQLAVERWGQVSRAKWREHDFSAGKFCQHCGIPVTVRGSMGCDPRVPEFAWRDEVKR